MVGMTDGIHGMCDRLSHELLTATLRSPDAICSALQIDAVLQDLECVARHARRVAEMTVFMLEGNDIRFSAANPADPSVVSDA